MHPILRAATLAALAVPGISGAVTYVDIPVPSARDHAFDADGNLYITAGNRLLRYDTQLCVLRATALGADLQGIDVSPDGRYMAVADRGLIGGQAHVFIYDTFGSRTPRRIDYAPVSLESGSFMVAWSATNQLYISGTFAGSGWLPLRRFDLANNTMHTMNTVTRETMLATSHDRRWLAMAEAGISSGPIRVLDTITNQYRASVNMNWYAFEVAIDGGGTRVVAPSYNGAFVYAVGSDAMTQMGVLGQYARHGPISAAFSPDSSLIVTANYSHGGPSLGGVYLYDASTSAPVMTLDPYAWGWIGNWGLRTGRITLSSDGRWLAATQEGRVRLYDVGAELGDSTLLGTSECATSSVAPRRIAEPSQRSPGARDFDAMGQPIGRSTGSR